MVTVVQSVHCKTGGSSGGGEVTPPTGSTDTAAWKYDSANRLLSRPGVSYSYDAKGNTTSMTDSTGITTYQYDYENRLIKTTKPDGSVIEYKYDPFGRRIEKTILTSTSTSTLYYVYDREDILFELDENNNIVTEYLHGPGIDEPIAMIKNNQAYYYHADGLGSVVAISDQNGGVVQKYEYDSFGQIIYVQDSNFVQPYTYTGREYDSESGLYYYRARYYDAKVGRFISEDPIGLEGGDVNFFAYMGNSPVNNIDPTGEVIPPVVAVIVCGVPVAVGLIGSFLYYLNPPKCDKCSPHPDPYTLPDSPVEPRKPGPPPRPPIPPIRGK